MGKVLGLNSTTTEKERERREEQMEKVGEER
jgi:hypothetical protein